MIKKQIMGQVDELLREGRTHAQIQEATGADYFYIANRKRVAADKEGRRAAAVLETLRQIAAVSPTAPLADALQKQGVEVGHDE